MKFFKRRQPRKHDLQGAISLIYYAMEIAWQPLLDRDHRPDEEELHHYRKFAEQLHQCAGDANYIHRCLQQRAMGRSAGAKKFNDPEAGDWHTPP